MKDALLTIDQAAAKLTVSKRSIYQLIATGELEAIRVHRMLRIEPAALERFLRAHRNQVELPEETLTPHVSQRARHSERDWRPRWSMSQLPGSDRYRQ